MEERTEEQSLSFNLPAATHLREADDEELTPSNEEEEDIDMEICNKASLTANNHYSDDSEEEVVRFDKVKMVKFLDFVCDEKLPLHGANNSNIERIEEVVLSSKNVTLLICNMASLNGTRIHRVGELFNGTSV